MASGAGRRAGVHDRAVPHPHGGGLVGVRAVLGAAAVAVPVLRVGPASPREAHAVPGPGGAVPGAVPVGQPRAGARLGGVVCGVCRIAGTGAGRAARGGMGRGHRPPGRRRPGRGRGGCGHGAACGGGTEAPWRVPHAGEHGGRGDGPTGGLFGVARAPVECAPAACWRRRGHGFAAHDLEVVRGAVRVVPGLAGAGVGGAGPDAVAQAPRGVHRGAAGRARAVDGVRPHRADQPVPGAAAVQDAHPVSRADAGGVRPGRAGGVGIHGAGTCRATDSYQRVAGGCPSGAGGGLPARGGCVCGEGVLLYTRRAGGLRLLGPAGRSLAAVGAGEPERRAVRGIVLAAAGPRAALRRPLGGGNAHSHVGTAGLGRPQGCPGYPERALRPAPKGRPAVRRPARRGGAGGVCARGVGFGGRGGAGEADAPSLRTTAFA